VSYVLDEKAAMLIAFALPQVLLFALCLLAMSRRPR